MVLLLCGCLCVPGVWGCSSADFGIGSVHDPENDSDADAGETADETIGETGEETSRDAPADLRDPRDTSEPPEAAIDAGPDADTDAGPMDSLEAGTDAGTDADVGGEVGCPVHTNGIGQTFVYCAPLGMPGVSSTYTIELARAARSSWIPTVTGTLSDFELSACVERQIWKSDGSAKLADAVWCYAGSTAGHVYSGLPVRMPTTSDPAWK